MCGIFGSIPILDEDRFKKGLQAIAHRGPDGEGYWSDGIIQLGHRRLSILDLSDAGKQPMEFGDLVVTFNGEIFNFLEIRNELKSLGYNFQTESDTEVLLRAYDRWGIDAFNKFNGMWAFAIYNKRNRRLIISRDRYGIKPLYYYFKDGQLIFGSEVQAIHKTLGYNHPEREEVMRSIVEGKFSWHGSTNTYLKDVYILPGGGYLELHENDFKVAKWYHLRQVEVPQNFTEQAEQLLSLIKDACTLRLRSDVPIGTCLSGGLDSGAITAVINNLADNYGNYTHKAFCASFPGTSLDESAKALRLAKQFNSSLDVINITPPSPDELQEALLSCDGPMHSLAFFPIWKLYKYIRQQGIIVTLDGQGPDEMLAGYRPIPTAIRTAIKMKDPTWLYDIYKTYSALGESKDFSSKLATKKFFAHTILIQMPQQALGIGADDTKNMYPFQENPLNGDLYQQFFVQPLPGILQQYDRCSMASGVECRMPFMDYRIVEYIFSLPVKSKIGNGFTKRILREAVKDLLPDETRLDKQKIGFNAPIVDWFTGPLRTWMLDIMSSEEYLGASWFDGKSKRKNFEAFLKSSKPQWKEAWTYWGGVHYAWWKKHSASQP
jgi:asparagine synthase (glutamine-hydrolysing)